MKYKLLEAFQTLIPIGAIVVTESTPISEGDYVKIGVETHGHSEKFWAVIYAIDRDNDRFAVRINQDLQLTHYHGLSDADELVVERKHIVAIIK